MKFLVIFSCLATLSLAQYGQNHGQSNQPAPVHYVNIGAQLQGDYKFGYNTGNSGSFREETRNPDGSVSGAYGYLDASGQQKIIRYTAGKDGFKAEGDDIPKAPAVPQQPAPQQYHQPQQYQQPQQYHQPQQYQQPQQPYHQPQPAYNQHVAPSYSQNNYAHSAAPQHYGGSQQGSYNPFAYNNAPSGSQGHYQPNPLSQLSYNIGAGGNTNHYQG